MSRVLFLSILCHVANSFSLVSPLTSRISRLSPLNLVPLYEFKEDLTFFTESDVEARGCFDLNGCFNDGDDIYQVCLVESNDLPDLCRFVVDAFGADAIRLSQNLNAFEKALMSPATELLNGYSTLIAFAEVFSGTKQRLTTRLEKMDVSPPKLDGLSRKEMLDAVEKDSLILALAKVDDDSPSIIASVELRLQVSCN